MPMPEKGVAGPAQCQQQRPLQQEKRKGCQESIHGVHYFCFRGGFPPAVSRMILRSSGVISVVSTN